MTEFQYTMVPGKLGPFFGKVRTSGIPAKAHVPWLKSLGFTSSNDNSILTIARALGFADQGGTPTDVWREYRGADYRVVMARAIKKAYKDLFGMYPDAAKRTDVELTNFFRTRSSGGDQVVSKTLSTFKSLVALADFDSDADASSGSHPGTPSTAHQRIGRTDAPDAKPLSAPNAPKHHAPSLHIDVQIHIASDATAEQIEQIFASMGKHLYKNSDE